MIVVNIGISGVWVECWLHRTPKSTLPTIQPIISAPIPIFMATLPYYRKQIAGYYFQLCYYVPLWNWANMFPFLSFNPSPKTSESWFWDHPVTIIGMEKHKYERNQQSGRDVWILHTFGFLAHSYTPFFGGQKCVHVIHHIPVDVPCLGLIKIRQAKSLTSTMSLWPTSRTLR